MKPDRKKNQPAPSRPAAPGDRREPAEPVVQTHGVPVAFFIIFAVLLFFSLLFLERHAGGFNAKVYPPYASAKQLEAMAPKSGEGAIFAQGKEVFNKTCLPCHQSTGMGTPGTFPPLVGSEWVLAEHPGRAIRIVLNGLQGPVEVKGSPWNNVMVPWRENLKDDEIAAVLTYVRNEWGNKAPPVKPEDVKAIREETKDRGEAWTAPELLKVPDKQ